MAKRNPACGCGEEAVCNEAELHCNPCCRCIPLRLCATFEPYGCSCDSPTDLLELNIYNEYQGSISCSSNLTVDITVSIYYHNSKCYWRVLCPEIYVDELFEIGDGGQSCEHPDLAVVCTIEDCQGLLLIKRRDLINVPMTLDSDCDERPFCDGCECTCDSLCVSLLEARTQSTCYGEIDLETYGGQLLGSPSWNGVISCVYKSYGLAIQISRDDYSGECVIQGDIDGETLPPTPVGNCATIFVQWILADGSILEVRCKECECLSTLSSPCCPDRCMPKTAVGGPPICYHPLPMVLEVDLLGGSDHSGDSCLTGSGTLTFKPAIEGGLNCWEGEVFGTCTEPCTGAPFRWSIWLRVCCDENGYFLVHYYNSDSACTGFQAGLYRATCDPVLIQGCFEQTIDDCFLPCLYDVYVIPAPKYHLCFSIYEVLT